MIRRDGIGWDHIGSGTHQDQDRIEIGSDRIGSNRTERQINPSGCVLTPLGPQSRVGDKLLEI